MPVFTEKRVPIKNLFNYLETGETLEQFFDDFPSVKKEQVMGLLEKADQMVTNAYETLNDFLKQNIKFIL